MKNIKIEAEYRANVEKRESQGDWEFDEHEDYLNERGYAYYEVYIVKQKIDEIKRAVLKKNYISVEEYDALNNENKLKHYEGFIKKYLENSEKDRDMDFELRKEFLQNIKELSNNNIDNKYLELLDINDRDKLFVILEENGLFSVSVDLYSYAIWFREKMFHHLRSGVSVFSSMNDNDLFKNITMKKSVLSFELQEEYKSLDKFEMYALFDRLFEKQIDIEINHENGQYAYVETSEIDNIVNSFLRERKLNSILNEKNETMQSGEEIKRKKKI